MFVSHARAPLIHILSDIGRHIRDIFGDREFGLLPPVIHRMLVELCETNNLLCGNLLFLVTGPEEGHMNMTRVPIYTAHSPSPTSVKNIVHFTQNFKNGSFRKFDYGEEENLLRYNSVIMVLYC